jgi:hypothetical protein
VDADMQSKPKKFKKSYASKLMPTVFWDSTERSADGGIHATRDHNVRNVL